MVRLCRCTRRATSNLFCVLLITIIFTVILSLKLLKVYLNDKDPSGSDDEEPYNLTKIEMKYILIWTERTDIPLSYLGTGRTVFISRKCKWTNCYVTSDRNYLGSFTEFEAILFHAPRLAELMKFRDIPKKRFKQQKYVFVTIEASSNYPVPKIWNGFFNWTWTYRLDSDSVCSYLVIRNATNHLIGPSKNIHWMKLSEMIPIDEEKILKLNLKKKAAAWFASNCDTFSERESLVKEIQRELQKYDLYVDIYGSCGQLMCPKDLMDSCLNVLENKYYFYFVFENALSEDYVTEKLLYPLQHDTVPIVYGGANYSRFMPDGIYLDAMEMNPQQLAKKMNEIIQYRELYYYDFFRWQNHYSYHDRSESPETDAYCQFCALLNNDKAMKTTTIYKQLNTWWNSHNLYTSYKQKYNVA